MNRFTHKILMLSAILAAFAIAPMASYGQSKVEDPKNVNVINTPNVTVSNTPKVLNANDSNIFQETRLKNGTNEPQEVFSYAVPLGKRLVIEFVSVNATIGEGEKMRAFIRAGNGFTIHPIIMNFQVTAASRDLFAGAQLMRMYAEPGTTVEILVSRRDAADTGAVKANAFIETSISGYLVDVP